MPQINVTTPFTAGLNAANDAAGGILEQRQTEIRNRLAREELDMTKRVQEQRAALAQEEMQQRRDEIARLTQERLGQTEALKKYGEIRGRQFQPKPPGPSTGNHDFFGGPIPGGGLPSSYQNDEEGQLNKFLQDQRDSINSFASTLSPEAQRTFLNTHLPLLDEDEKNERLGVATRKTRRRLDEALGSGILDPEEQSVVEDARQGLDAGVYKLGDVSKMFDDIKRTAKRRLKRQQDYQWGTQWASQQIQEASQGGANPGPLHDALADWITSDDLDPEKLRQSIIEKRYGLKTDKFKVGRSEIPKDATLGDWKEVADVEAEQEAYDVLAKDKDYSPTSPEGIKRLDATKRKILRKYAIQSRIPSEMFDQMFPPPSTTLGDDEIRAKLKEAGIDPDMELPKPSMQDKARNLDPNKVRSWIPAADQPPTPKPQADGRDMNGDGVYDEEDLPK